MMKRISILAIVMAAFTTVGCTTPYSSGARPDENTGNRSLPTAECLVFSATWCGPCKQAHAMLDDLRKEFPTVTFREIDVDENRDLAQKYNVSSIPRFVVQVEGQVVGSQVGLSSLPEMKQFILKSLNKRSGG